MGPVAGAQQIYQLKGALWVGGGWEKVALVWQPPLFLDVSLYVQISIPFFIFNHIQNMETGSSKYDMAVLFFGVCPTIVPCQLNLG